MPRAKVSLHAKKRLNERYDVHRKQDANKLFKLALVKGKSPSDYKPPMYDYLMSKTRSGRQVKVYDNKVFIYSSRKTLITSYELPDKYKDIIEGQKTELEIKREINQLKNKDLKTTFINEFDLFIALMILGKSVGLLQDEETLKNISDKCMRLNVMILILQKKTNARDLKCKMKIDKDNVIVQTKNSLEQFKELIVLAKGFRKKGTPRPNLYNDLTEVLLELKLELDYFKKINFFISESVKENIE